MSLYKKLTRRVYNHEFEIQLDYLSFLELKLKIDFHMKWKTDGYSIGIPEVLTEFKNGWNLRNKKVLCKSLIQALVYISVLEKEEALIPKFVFIATQDYYCFFDSEKIINYRHLVYNETEASTAWERHPDLMKILEKEVIIPVFNVSKNIDSELLSYFKSSNNQKAKIETKDVKTITRLLAIFTEMQIILEDLSTHSFVNIFIGILCGFCKPVEDEEILSTNIKKYPQIRIDRRKYDKFISTIETIIDINIFRQIPEVKAELIDQIIRRYQGEFPTPQKIIKLSDKYLSNFFGSLWSKRFLREPTSGLFQLTKDYSMPNAFLSTINQEDLDLAEKLGFNPEIKPENKFQYDWLNDDCDLEVLSHSSKLPKEYIEYCKKGYPEILLSNWPYGAAGDNKNIGTGKDNIANTTKVHRIMNESPISFNKAMENLYTQCLYRCILHKKQTKHKVYIACYCPVTVLTGSGFKEFRKEFFKHFIFEMGYIIPAKVFKGLDSDWPIMFAIFSPGSSLNTSYFELDEYDENLIFKGKTIQYNNDDKSTPKDWIKEVSNYRSDKKKVPVMASAFNVGKRSRDDLIDEPNIWPLDSFSLLVCDSNTIEKSKSRVYIINSGVRHGLGRITINKNNLYRCLTYFTVRKVSTLNYSIATSKNEFLYPDTKNPKLTNLMYDSLVYASFNDSSQQASLGNVWSCTLNWEIENQLFWNSKDKILELSRRHKNIPISNHIYTSSKERILFLELQKIKKYLSGEAINVLNEANRLLEVTFHKRNDFDFKKPDVFINRWDAGWRQICKLIDFCNEDKSNFNHLYKVFEKYLLKQIYDVGFLRN